MRRSGGNSYSRDGDDGKVLLVSSLIGIRGLTNLVHPQMADSLEGIILGAWPIQAV